MEGLVIHWDVERWFGIVVAGEGVRYVVSTDDNRFFVRGSDIMPDEVGSRHLLIGERVSFDEIHGGPVQRRHDGGTERKAGNVRPLLRNPRPSDYTEDCVVSVVMRRWNQEPVCGWAKRPDGDSLFWHQNDVTTIGAMEVGAKFNCVPAPNQNAASSRWAATLIEIYIPE